MLKVIFYFFGFVAIYYEFWSIQNNDRITKLMNKFTQNSKDASKAIPNLTESTFAIMQILYICWGAVGLFTSQWLLFLLIFLLSAINYKVQGNKIWNVVDAILTIAIIMFAIINTFHLHIPLLNKIIEFYS